MILRSGILVEHLVQSNLSQNWALYSLPDSVVAAGGYEVNVCPCGKNGSHWPNYHGHWGKKEIQVLVEVSVSLFRQHGNWEKPPVTSRILKKQSVGRIFLEGNLGLTPRWAQAHWHGLGSLISLRWPLSQDPLPAGTRCVRTNPGQRTPELWHHGLHTVHKRRKFPTENPIFHLIK